MSWDAASQWYGDLVGEKGHYYHQSVIFPKLLSILKHEKIDSWLDLGCGNGIWAKQLRESIEYFGVDSSKELIKQAKKMSIPTRHFFIANASQPIPIEKNDFSHASFILSLQNMEHGGEAITSAAKHLRNEGKLFIVLNHPCFRIPRQSDWGFDERTKIQYRRMNLYMNSLQIPISTSPGKEKSSVTYSFHHPLSTYSQWLKNANLRIVSIEEWCSDKKSEGGRAKAEDRARLEFPLFLTIIAEKK